MHSLASNNSGVQSTPLRALPWPSLRTPLLPQPHLQTMTRVSAFQGLRAVERLLVALPTSLLASGVPASEGRVSSPPFMEVVGDADGESRSGGNGRECRGVGDCIPLGLALRNAELAASQRPYPHLPPLRSEQHFDSNVHERRGLKTYETHTSFGRA